MKITKFVFALILFAQVCLAQGDHSQNTIPQITLGAEDDWFPYCGEFHKVNHGIGPDIVRAAYAAVGVKVDYLSSRKAPCFSYGDISDSFYRAGCSEVIAGRNIY